MQDFEGKIAVVTGAASGIGRALAERFASEGMKLVLADIEAEPLKEVTQTLERDGVEVLSSLVDVSDAAAVEVLAEQTVERFGVPHLVCNNAGVAAGGLCWQVPAQEWDWIIGVNLVGVVNGIRSFGSRMVDASIEGHIVNTASVAGLTAPGFMSPYNTTKHAVVALSETLFADLQFVGASIGVSVLCPGWVATRIHESDRNKPGESQDAAADQTAEALRQLVGQTIADGMQPGEIAAHVVDAIRNGTFYIRTHPGMEEAVVARCKAVADNTAPSVMSPTDISQS